MKKKVTKSTKAAKKKTAKKTDKKIRQKKTVELSRIAIRYDPDPNTTAWISIDLIDFSKDFIALVENESHSGCRLITHRDTGLKIESTCLVACGHLEPLKSKVAWITEISPHIFKIGFQYLE